MSQYEEYLPDSPYIQFVWRALVSEVGSFNDIAHDFWVLVFRTRPGFAEVILTGPVTQPEIIRYDAGQTNWGIVFKPHVFIADLPKRKMLNSRTRLVVRGGSFTLGKHQLLIPTYQKAEMFVEELADKGVITASPVIAKALSGKPPAMSTRNLQRHYVTTAGLTKSQIAQIQRARRAFVLLEQGKTIAEVAQAAGYADQAHLTRSLKLLAGQTPGQIIRDYFSA